MELHQMLAVLFVFGGCIANSMFLEAIVREVPSSGNIITFLQFFFIAIHGFFSTTKCLTVKPVIPIRCYGTMVSYFIVVSLLNNIAPNFHIPMPLHMIFRSGSLVSSLILGIIILEKSYKITTYLSVVMITIGISIATIVSAKNLDSGNLVGSSGDSAVDVMWMGVGVTILIISLVTTSRLGIYQEVLYKEYGKHPNEALFYSHCLPLPVFLLLVGDIYRHIILYNASDYLVFQGITINIPRLWFYIIGNCVTQFICIRSVFVLTTEFTSLSVTLVVTLRKFISIMVSVFFFKNSFTIYHWIATALVFSGTFMFLDLHNRLLQIWTSETKDEKKTQ
ncbi:UDP-xylose and UDP-N-acetylglucosamine transporter-like [Dendronephthya gigantea]|uniref:UDP-xylose and UDP-N-acetylglucosamine transporter-like n=1 Tax=Dendronephthya gigantea TaxID=151771 RepID=UPI00106C8981|nr:UDP-xylose and UDP-N-acetylglucosamine transporter-like [Dendronephthya gigantea]